MPPYEADFSVVLTGPNLRSNACVGACTSWWDESKNAITPSARSERVTSSACSDGIPGLIVDVGAELVVAEPAKPDHVEIVYRSRSGALNEQRRVTPALPLKAVFSERNELFGFTFRSTLVRLADEAVVLDLQKLRPEKTDYTATAAWSNDSGFLLAVDNGSYVDPSWLFVERDTHRARWLATAGAGTCGHPLTPSRALLLDGVPPGVVSLSLDQSQPPQWIAGNPLTDSYCVSASEELVTVTGRIGSTAAVSIHDGAAWHSVTFPEADGEGEAIVDGERIYVAFPAEPGISHDGKALPRVGAIYSLERSGAAWSVAKKYQAARPRADGLFGMEFRVVDDALFVTYLTDHAHPTTPKTTLGDFRTCRVDR